MTSALDDYRERAGRLWSGSAYQTYRRAVWTWKSLPFAPDPAQRRTPPARLFRNPLSLIGRAPRFVPPWTDPPRGFVEASAILEVGSAQGNAYRFLRDSGLVDTSGYLGCDVSQDGQAYCREQYPEAAWHEGDFTQFALPRRFDYAFERYAIHHMPQPIAQIQKVLDAVDIAAKFAFFGRVEGDTVSDLERSFFVQRTVDADGEQVEGRYFGNLINVLEVARMARRAGFNHIGVLAFAHEAFPASVEEVTGVNNHVVLPEVLASGGEVLTYDLFVAKVPQLDRPLLYAETIDRRVRFRRAFRTLRRELGRIG
jgi:hypothetical protein